MFLYCPSEIKPMNSAFSLADYRAYKCVEYDGSSYVDVHFESVESLPLGLPPLTLEDGAALTGAILMLWIIAWVGRQVIRVIRR